MHYLLFTIHGGVTAHVPRPLRERKYLEKSTAVGYSYITGKFLLQFNEWGGYEKSDFEESQGISRGETVNEPWALSLFSAHFF